MSLRVQIVKYWNALKTLKGAASAVLKGNRGAVRKALSLLRAIETIRASEFFDAEWYLKNNPDVAAARIDPAKHYFIYGGIGFGRNPSPYFINDEYYALHNDVKLAKMNPLFHYENFGKKEGRTISYLEEKSPEFPEGTIEGEWRFARASKVHGRTAIVATYLGQGKVPDTLAYLLKALKQVADNIILVGDSPVFEAEVCKLGPLVTAAIFKRHCRYDFGSYKIGYEFAKAEGLLNRGIADELIVMNDSNYGPVFPFEESFEIMNKKSVDFWGYTGYNAFGYVHISSYFYLFRRSVLESGKLEELFAEVSGEVERDKVIVKFEFRWTKRLEEAGFKWATFVPIGFKKGAPTKYPISLTAKYRMPLVKVKAVNGDSFEDVDKALKLVRKFNPELAALITPRKIQRTHRKISYQEHQKSFPDKVAAIKAKVARGEKIKAIFLLSSASMFPLRPLYDAMNKDARFDTYLAVIPDMRWRDGKMLEEMEVVEKEVAAWYPEGRILTLRPDEFDIWPDILEDVDIVGYPSPYEMSSFRYNPHYAIGRKFLPICANYGYYRSIYDRVIMGGQSYAYMWKAFFECEETAKEYCEYSAIGGTNVDVSGYIKMDAFAAVKPQPHTRKRILVALHHSVEGGTNKSLSLANFIEYADYFMSLPDRYPEIDFVFRPHPFLFKILVNRKIWRKEKVERYLAELKAKKNVIWSSGGDYFKEFAESDGCIQDCGSFLVEYFYTGKPCCFMLKSPKDIDAKFAPLGKDCLGQCYLAYDTKAIDRFVYEVIVCGNDEKAPQRKSFVDKVKVNYPHAADVALRHIKEALI